MCSGVARASGQATVPKSGDAVRCRAMCCHAMPCDSETSFSTVSRQPFHRRIEALGNASSGPCLKRVGDGATAWYVMLWYDLRCAMMVCVVVARLRICGANDWFSCQVDVVCYLVTVTGEGGGDVRGNTPNLPTNIVPTHIA